MSVQTGEQNTLITMSEHLQLKFLHSVDKLASKKYAETINLLFAGNKVFVTYQTEVLTPTPTCVRPWQIIYRQWFRTK